jgi:acetylornithine deacetylase/succinyl-diaminopimelate desuccinylase-like protein
MLTAHVDTVFAHSTSLDTTVDGDRLCGPGVGDNAAAIAVVVNVVVCALAKNDPLAAAAVVFTVGEEGMGNLRGARAALEELSPYAMIAVEGHGLENVLVDAVGSVRSRIEIVGSGGHSWVDRGVPSAVHEALRIGQALLNSSSEESPVNIGVICGGSSVNTIAESSELSVEVRSTDRDVLARFETALDALGEASPLDVTLLELARRPAGVLDRSSPLLEVVERARRDVGLPFELSAGSTDANAAFAHGVPALSIGVAHGRRMHSVDEEISISSLTRGTQQLGRIIELMLH